MKIRLASFPAPLSLLAALLCAAALPFSAHAQAPSQAPAQEQRIVAVGGALTEIVYALGAEKRLVAVDTTSIYPEAALRLPKVGYMRSLSSEGLLAMKPSVVLATSEAGPPQAISQLKSAGVRIELVNADHTFEELRNKVKVVAAALGMEAQGRKLDDSLQAEWQATQNAAQAVSARKPKVLFILSHTPSNTMVSGQGTAADAVIRYAGGVNAMQGFTGYKPLSAEAVIGAAPDFILITREGLEAIGGPDKLWEKPGLALTPAAKGKRYAAPDALYLLGFGPRMPQAVRELAGKLRAG
jgi:iron complex transport system substrate-binding protein